MYEHARNELFYDHDDLLQVVAVGNESYCNSCHYFNTKGECRCRRDIAGMCMRQFRRDGLNVIFFRVSSKNDVRLT